MKYSKNYITKTGCSVLVRNAVAQDANEVTNISNQNYQDCPFLSKGARIRVIVQKERSLI